MDITLAMVMLIIFNVANVFSAHIPEAVVCNDSF